MPKPLKFDDASVQAEDAPRRIPNTAEVKEFLSKIHKKMEEMDDLKSDLKQLYDDAEEQGIDRGALKFVAKLKKKPLSEEKKKMVNELLEKSGEQLLFAFA